jgi:hypothetical protein
MPTTFISDLRKPNAGQIFQKKITDFCFEKKSEVGRKLVSVFLRPEPAEGRAQVSINPFRIGIDG